MILDSRGDPVTSNPKLVHGSSENRMRGPQYRLENKEIEDLISQRDRDVIVSLCVRLFFNMGPFKSVVDQKSTYSVGQAYLPTYKGPDTETGKEVAKWFTNVFFKTLDLRAGLWDWWQNLEGVSKEMDVRGDHFTLLTTDDTGTLPRIKIIPAHAVWTKHADRKSNSKYTVKDGPYAGSKIAHGIIYEEDGKVLAYRVSTGCREDEYEDIDAASIIHQFDPTLCDDGRGLPAASHSLEDLKHILQSTEYERSRQLILSSIGLFIENESGGPDSDPASYFSGTSTTQTDGELTTQEISPQIWYAEAGGGAKITQLKHETGGDSFESFQDRMIRSFVKGAKWSYSLTWKPTGQGTSERGEILMARKAVQERQKRLDNWALRILTYAYSMANKAGLVPDLEEPFNWEFTRPPRLSVDDGREHKMLLEGFRLGSRTLTDLLEFEGRTFEEHTDRRLEEEVYRQTKIIEIEAANEGVKIDPRAVVTFQSNQPEQVGQSNNE